MVGRSLRIDWFMSDVFHWLWGLRKNAVITCVLVYLQTENGLIPFDRGSCGNWNEPGYSQYWCHLWNQYGTDLLLLQYFVSVGEWGSRGWVWKCMIGKKKNVVYFYLFRTTLQLSSSVSGGVTPGWCSQETRASVWMGGWCHCCGSLTPSSQTPNAPSCMMSQWKTASYASSATEPYSMPFGRIFFFFLVLRLKCIDLTFTDWCNILIHVLQKKSISNSAELVGANWPRRIENERLQVRERRLKMKRGKTSFPHFCYFMLFIWLSLKKSETKMCHPWVT